MERVQDDVMWQGPLGKPDLQGMVHYEGEELFLSVLRAESVPAICYLGLDNRPTVRADQRLSDLVDEPLGNGYSRQPVSSDATGWTTQHDDETGKWGAQSKEVTFAARGGRIGPVRRLFLTTAPSGKSGILIATKTFFINRTLEDGAKLMCGMLIQIGPFA